MAVGAFFLVFGCGEINLAWVQSKSGKWYLAPARKFHGAALGGDRGYSKGGWSVSKHQPHKCDEVRPVCELCGGRHDPNGENSRNWECELELRRQAMADPQWSVKELKSGGSRVSLDAGDHLIEIEAFPGEPIELSIFASGQAVEREGIRFLGHAVESIEAGQKMALDLLEARG